MKYSTMNPNAALLCVSAATGEAVHENDDKTLEYIAVVKVLGIPQIAVAVTKMDSTRWSEDRHTEIVKDASNVLRHNKPDHYDPKKVPFVTVSGLEQDNLFEESPVSMISVDPESLILRDHVSPAFS